MDYIVPLLQNGVWLGIVGFLFKRYDGPVLEAIAAFRKHLEEAERRPDFPEVSDLRPLDPEERLDKVCLDLAEVQPVPGYTEPLPVREALVVSKQVHAKYTQAQDLALRAIQTDYGVSVGRQLTGGADIGFDGVFSHEGKLNIVEVKFVSALFNEKSMKQSVERITASVLRYGWINVRILLVVVFENGEGLVARIAQLKKQFAANPVPVVVTVYSLPELRAKDALSPEKSPRRLPATAAAS